MKNKLLILCGIPFSGKSTLASELSQLYKYVHIDLDQIKNEVVGTNIEDEEINQSTWDEIYKIMYTRIEQSLVTGNNVVHDTGNFTVYERSLINKIALKLNIPYLTVYVDISKELAYSRLLANRKNKLRFNITDEAFTSAVNEMETPQDNEKTIIYTSNDKVATWAAKYHLIP